MLLYLINVHITAHLPKIPWKAQGEGLPSSREEAPIRGRAEQAEAALLKEGAGLPLSLPHGRGKETMHQVIHTEPNSTLT